MKRCKLFFRKILLWLCRRIGSRVRDARTGAVLGRALFLPWKGGIRVVGAQSSWIPVPLPQARITYWRQDIGFTLHDPPPTPRSPAAAAVLAASAHARKTPKPLLVVLDHRPPASVLPLLQIWRDHGVAREALLLAYGGPEASFAALDVPQKIFLADPKLRTRDHQRERQSYRGVLAGVTAWMRDTDFTHVLFMEYDQVPLAADVPDAYLRRMAELDADVLGYAVHRIDGTLHPHWLGLVEKTFPTEPVWSMLGTGHFWKREVWEAVTAREDRAGWYLELDFATSVVDGGFRLAGLPDQDPYVQALPENLRCGVEKARQQGAWTLHPQKVIRE